MGLQHSKPTPQITPLAPSAAGRNPHLEPPVGGVRDSPKQLSFGTPGSGAVTGEGREGSELTEGGSAGVESEGMGSPSAGGEFPVVLPQPAGGHQPGNGGGGRTAAAALGAAAAATRERVMSAWPEAGSFPTATAPGSATAAQKAATAPKAVTAAAPSAASCSAPMAAPRLVLSAACWAPAAVLPIAPASGEGAMSGSAAAGMETNAGVKASADAVPPVGAVLPIATGAAAAAAWEHMREEFVCPVTQVAR